MLPSEWQSRRVKTLTGHTADTGQKSFSNYDNENENCWSMTYNDVNGNFTN